MVNERSPATRENRAAEERNITRTTGDGYACLPGEVYECDGPARKFTISDAILAGLKGRWRL